jgi:Na+/melibiose symporter-like transporter
MALLGLPFWGWMCQKYERHHVWGVSLSVAALSYGTLGCLPIGEGGLYVILVLYPITLLCFSCLVIALPAILGDIVDYDRLRSGEDRSGIYSAILAFLGKSLLSVTAALGLAVAGWLGFDATASEQTFWGGFGIRLTSMWLPALGFAMSVPLIWWFPLNRARQAEIREALRRRESSLAPVSAPSAG